MTVDGAWFFVIGRDRLTDQVSGRHTKNKESKAVPVFGDASCNRLFSAAS